MPVDPTTIEGRVAAKRDSPKDNTANWISLAAAEFGVSLPKKPRAIQIPADGTVVVADGDGDVMILTISAFTPYPCSPDRILDSGTNAAGIVGTTSAGVTYVDLLF